MPLCSIHLLALHSATSNPILTFLTSLKSSNLKPLVISRVIRWIILPTTLSTESLLARNIHWDLYLVLPDTVPFPAHLSKLIQHHWTITAGVPSRLVENFSSKNAKLLHPNPASVPKLVNASPASTGGKATPTTESSQNLELSAGLENWIQETTKAGGSEIQGAVSMFNLLAFKPDMKSEYLKYGAAFAKSIGSRHGGNAKIVGNVVASKASQQEATPSTIAAGSRLDNKSFFDASADGWDEIALAHYPSILHFRDMLLSKDYQEVNHRHRVPSLKDTCILMTSELGIEEMVKAGYGAKL